MQFIDLKKQHSCYKKEIDQAIQEVIESSCFILGPKVQLLEETLAQFVEVKHCIAVSNGTDGLLLALMALGIGPGDEVITTPFSFVATSQVIATLGATPVFIDIDPLTYNMNPKQLEQVITSRTKAIMPISLFGQVAKLKEINDIAKKNNLPVIEDGAQSFGAKHNGKKCCGITTIGVTSFFPTKTFGCYGDGGAIFTNDDVLAEKLKVLRVHGGPEKHHYVELGTNARLDALQAAILLAKFPHFSKEIEERQKLGNRYTELLKNICTTPFVDEGNDHTYAQYTIRVPQRSLVVEELQKRGIPSAVYYPRCIDEQPAFAYLGHTQQDFPEAKRASREVLNLPMHPWLTFDEQDLVVNALREILQIIQENKIVAAVL